jgi:hypothetical protein
MLYIGTTKYNTILVVVNYYTKIAKLILTTTNLAIPEFTALFYKNINLKYSSLRGIVSN